MSSQMMKQVVLVVVVVAMMMMACLATPLAGAAPVAADELHDHMSGCGHADHKEAAGAGATAGAVAAAPSTSTEASARPKRQAEQAGNVMGFLSNLGPQVQGGLSSLFSSSSSSAPLASSVQQAPGAVQQSASGLMGQLSELVRSAQDSGSKSASQAQQQVTETAQAGQSGFVQAISELGEGIKRITSNSPSLMPDVKQLYSNISQRLSSATSSNGGAAAAASNIQPATNSEQLADNLAKVLLRPQSA